MEVISYISSFHLLKSYMSEHRGTSCLSRQRKIFVLWSRPALNLKQFHWYQIQWRVLVPSCPAGFLGLFSATINFSGKQCTVDIEKLQTKKQHESQFLFKWKEKYSYILSLDPANVSAAAKQCRLWVNPISHQSQSIFLLHKAIMRQHSSQDIVSWVFSA